MIGMRSRYKRAFAIVADAVCAIAAPALLRGARKAKPLPKAPRVLLIRCDHIGDASMAAPLLQSLRQELNASRLDVLVAPWTKDLFLSNPAVNDVLVYATPWWLSARSAPGRKRREAWRALPAMISQIRRKHYDIGIDLRGDLRHILFFLALGGCRERVSTDRTGGKALLTRYWPFNPELHELEKSIRVIGTLGVSVNRKQVTFPLPALSAELERELEGAARANGLVAIATQGNQPSRAWPLPHALELAKRLSADLGVGIVFIGGAAERSVGDMISDELGPSVVNIAGRTTLPETVAVLAHTKALVTVDSGPMHLAGLAGTPVVGLFGAGDPTQFGPWSSTSAIVRPPGGCSCPLATHCSLTADGHGACMQTITPASAVVALAQLLPESFPAPLCTPA